MKLSLADIEEISGRLAGLAAYQIGDTQVGGLSSKTEDVLEDVLAPELGRLLGRLEFPHGGGVFLMNEVEPTAPPVPGLVTH